MVGRAEMNCCLFMLWSLLHYMHAVSRRTLDVRPSLSLLSLRPDSRHPRGRPDSASLPLLRLQVVPLMYALGLALLAVLSKENGITTVGVFLLYELLDMALPTPEIPAEEEEEPENIALQLKGAHPLPLALARRCSRCARGHSHSCTRSSLGTSARHPRWPPSPWPLRRRAAAPRHGRRLKRQAYPRRPRTPAVSSLTGGVPAACVSTRCRW